MYQHVFLGYLAALKLTKIQSGYWPRLTGVLGIDGAAPQSLFCDAQCMHNPDLKVAASSLTMLKENEREEIRHY